MTDRENVTRQQRRQTPLIQGTLTVDPSLPDPRFSGSACSFITPFQRNFALYHFHLQLIRFVRSRERNELSGRRSSCRPGGFFRSAASEAGHKRWRRERKISRAASVSLMRAPESPVWLCYLCGADPTYGAGTYSGASRYFLAFIANHRHLALSCRIMTTGCGDCPVNKPVLLAALAVYNGA